MKKLLKNPIIKFIIFKLMNFSYIFSRRKIRGSFNKIKTSENLFKNCRININGNNNVVNFGKQNLLSKVSVYINGSDNKISIGDNIRIYDGCSLYIEDNNCSIEIADNSTFHGFFHPAVTENNSKIIIGKDCMFSKNIDLRTGDSHSIIDLKSGKRINYAKDIKIGNHFWVGANVTILKGSEVQDNSVIGTGSIISSKFEKSNIIIAGVPGKKIKEDIDWKRERMQ